MTRSVLDASALLALLLGEPVVETVKPVLNGAMMTVVNLAEVVGHYAKLGGAAADIRAMLLPLPIHLAQVDEALSYAAGMLRPLTLERGLYLGDRYCLALAKRESAPALTADWRWLEIATAVAVQVELIR